MSDWTREEIIRELLRREASGLTLTAGRKTGVEAALYQGARRVFGSWLNAIAAAGIPIERATSHERWPPARILSSIQSLARRKHPLRPKEFSERYSNLASAARRVFGSWPRAVIAAGVDPGKLRPVPQWTPERVIEGILIRVLNNEPLRSRSVQPKALMDAGVRLFGNWRNALAAAGVDPNRNACHKPVPVPLSVDQAGAPRAGAISITTPISLGDLRWVVPHKRGTPWTDEALIHAILVRLNDGHAMNAKAVYREDRGMLRAAHRKHDNWTNALVAAGLNPLEHQRKKIGRNVSASTESQVPPG